MHPPCLTAPATFGQPVSFTATVRPASGTPIGSIGFLVNGTFVGSAPIAVVVGTLQASVTTTALPVGAHVISAVYFGDGMFGTSAAGPILHQVR